MIENPEKSSAAEALKQVLAAKRAATQDGGAFSSAAGAQVRKDDATSGCGLEQASLPSRLQKGLRARRGFRVAEPPP